MRSIHIIYRCCELETGSRPIRKSRPPFFNKETCLRNALRTLLFSELYPEVKTKFTIVHDGPEGPLYDIASISEEGGHLDIVRIASQSNMESYKAALDVARLSDCEAIYMLEDDYLHTDNARQLLIEGLDKFNIITGYFHTDRLTRNDDITRGHESISATPSSHWVTNESTTCTWACTKDVRSTHLFNYAYLHTLNDRLMWRELWLRESLRLWVPTPGFSTHLESGLMTPFINWKEINDRHSNF